MLFILMGKPRAGNPQERIARRLQWQYPEGLRVVAEYWPQGGEYAVIIDVHSFIGTDIDVSWSYETER